MQNSRESDQESHLIPTYYSPSLDDNYQHFSFDEFRFTQWLRETHGLTDEQIAASSVHFEAPNWLQRVMCVGGYTNRQDNSIHILDNWGGVTDALLAHEGTHLGDNFSQPEIFQPGRTRLLVRTYLGSALVALASGDGYRLIHQASHNPAAEAGLMGASLLSVAVMLGSYALYRHMPHEVRAWQASRQCDANFIQASRRPIVERILRRFATSSAVRS